MLAKREQTSSCKSLFTFRHSSRPSTEYAVKSSLRGRATRDVGTARTRRGPACFREWLRRANDINLALKGPIWEERTFQPSGAIRAVTQTFEKLRMALLGGILKDFDLTCRATRECGRHETVGVLSRVARGAVTFSPKGVDRIDKAFPMAVDPSNIF